MDGEVVPETRAEELLAAARGNRARLHFLLELGHELRTPAGTIAACLSLARHGDMPAEEAVAIAGRKADELCGLLDQILEFASAQLGQRDGWPTRLQSAHSESERLRHETEDAIASASALLGRLHEDGKHT